MQHAKSDNFYIVRLQKGEEVFEALTVFAKKEGITVASISGIGAVTDATLSCYNMETKAYEKQLLSDDYEVLSLLGNLSMKDDEPFPHIHVVLGKRDLSTIGGHLHSATVSVTLELFVQKVDLNVSRVIDEETELCLLDL